MWLAASAIVALVTYLWSLEAVRAGRAYARGASLLSSLGLAVSAGVVAAAGLALHELRCDDGCVGRDQFPGYGWAAYPDSWQWDLQLWLAVGGFAASALVVWWTLMSRYARAVVALGVGLALCGTWTALILGGYS